MKCGDWRMWVNEKSLKYYDLIELYRSTEHVIQILKQIRRVIERGLKYE